MSAAAGLPDIDIGRWVRCEREALHGPDGQSSGRTHVASLVRQGAMRRLAGEDDVTLELGFPVQLDETTRLDDVPRQAATIAAEANRLLDGHDPDAWRGIEVLAVTSRGWLVKLFRESDMQVLAILHLHTGRTIGAAWLELGRVLKEYSPSDRPEFAGIVHVPRTRIDRECKGTMTVRDGRELVSEWRSWERRVQAVLIQGSTPLARPGVHCQRCLLACGVRAWACGSS